VYPIPGHLALSLAGSKVAKVPFLPAIAATFFVDVADKLAIDIFHIAPYGRCWFHTLLSVLVCTAIVWKWKGKEWGLSWAIGHFLHLLGDIGFIPWFYPFLTYTWPDSPNMVAVSAQGVKEAVSGLQLVETESGGVGFAGWHFSDAVLAVFRGKLILAEMGMLVCIGGMLYWEKLQTKWVIVLWSLFFLFWGWRLLYQLPGSIDYVAPYIGNWIRL